MMKLEKENGKKEVYSGEMREGTRAQKEVNVRKRLHINRVRKTE